MSYATMQDVLFALDLTDSELQDSKLHLDTPKAEPELPETRSGLRRVSQHKAAVKIRRAA